MKKRFALSPAVFVFVIISLLISSCGALNTDAPQPPGDGAPSQADTANSPDANTSETNTGAADTENGQASNAASGSNSGTTPSPNNPNDPDYGEQGEPGAAGSTPAPQTPHTPETPQPPDGTPGNTAEPSATPQPDDAPVVLTIRGDGVSGETTWTLNQLKALSGGYRECRYSTTNNWPVFAHMRANGVSLPYLLREAGMVSEAVSFKFIATDGYNVTVTYDQVFGTRYSYANHTATGSSGASAVEPVIAWEWGDNSASPENIRPFFGQRGPYEVNTLTFVKGLHLIEVSTATPGAWAAPEASIDTGTAVSAGTELAFSHGSLDNIRIYYTLDGSEPNFNSLVYNLSTTYYQSHLIVPIILTESTTIKAFAAGFGKDPSPIATFNIVVE